MNVTGGFVDHGLYPCSETHEVLVGVNEKAGTVIVNPVHVRAKTGDCINWKVVPSETTITRIKFMDTDEEAAAAGKERSTHPIGRLICTGALRECGVYVALDSGHYVYRLDVQHRGTPMTGDPEIEVSCSCP